MCSTFDKYIFFENTFSMSCYYYIRLHSALRFVSELHVEVNEKVSGLFRR